MRSSTRLARAAAAGAVTVSVGAVALAAAVSLAGPVVVRSGGGLR